ncbi:MAG: ferritin-like domain-containing protein [Candidatus Sericytochromatia bacterium]|nr:ferritin-like domain-containing protein [Candidatus Tanganyikabacteria bacterium]
MDDSGIGRRALLQQGLAGTLLALGGVFVPEAAWARGKKDLVAALHRGVERELRAAWAYRTAAGTGKLSDGVLAIASTFGGQHREHAEALSTALRKLGADAPHARKTYDLSAFAPDLANERGIVILAIKLESEAVKAYHHAVSTLKEAGLRSLAASILADEAMHVAVLRDALGLDPVPSAFVTDPATWPLG